MRVVVLISGRGSNMEQLILQARHYSVVGVVSNKSDALGLQIAARHGIPNQVVSRPQFENKEQENAALLSTVAAMNPDLICLAGFMKILPSSFIDPFAERILNIHPSLLPAYPGLDTHARAIAAGDSLHGCSVHLVDAGLDSGAVVAQARCPIEVGDTPEILAARVLPLEHRLFPWVVNAVGAGDISLHGVGGVRYSGECRSVAAQHGFHLP